MLSLQPWLNGGGHTTETYWRTDCKTVLAGTHANTGATKTLLNILNKLIFEKNPLVPLYAVYW